MLSVVEEIGYIELCSAALAEYAHASQMYQPDEAPNPYRLYFTKLVLLRRWRIMKMQVMSLLRVMIMDGLDVSRLLTLSLCRFL
jgi:hypothetical protein